ncbi:MAG: hypothetical protein MJZ81_09735 [Bacteroidales bacterium]|nr:hypothetical protein [Bacteroidales bacterium]
MKRLILITLALLSSCSLLAQVCRQYIDKDVYFYHTDGRSYEAHVPGCIHTDLLHNGLIPDPFVASNEDEVQWVADREWSYFTVVTVCDALMEKEHIELVFDGLQCYADISLYGEPVLRADNMFRQWRVAVDKNLVRSHGGKLDINIVFHPTKPFDDSLLARLGFDMPDHRVFSRTAPYQQGWDWGPVLNSCGIWKQFYLEAWDGEKRDPVASDNTHAFKSFPYKNVHLRQNDDAIGREFTFVANGKPVFVKGANWIPVHSFPILDDAQRARYRSLLCSAKDANFNMIRVWGGGIYEHDYFFDLCDSLGLMVWVDFDFSCNVYPFDDNFLANVKIEAEEQVRRLARHPCIVLWCGNNEVKNGWEDWGWQSQFSWTEEQRAALNGGIQALFGRDGILHQAVKRYMPWVDYHPSSPEFGWGHPECTTHGDSHYWGVWWGEQPFEMYRDRVGRFMSEYGFMAYPQLSTIAAWGGVEAGTIEEKNARQLLDESWMKTHQRHGRGVEIIDQALSRYYGTSSAHLSLSSYVYLTQLAQAYGTGMGIEAHLMHRDRCSGTLYWQFNDCWPVASWSSIDFYGNWKALHYRARELYADEAVLFEPQNDARFTKEEYINGPGLGEWGTDVVLSSCSVNIDVVAPRKVRRVKARLMDFDGNVLQKQVLKRSKQALNGGFSYSLDEQYDMARVLLQVQSGRTKRNHFFVYPKDLELPKATIATSVVKEGDRYLLTLTTDKLAKDVQLSTKGGILGHFSDNYFDLLPGETKTVVFTPRESVDDIQFLTLSLQEVLGR